ncbi:MAG: hypothetical protein ACP5UD_09565, partial [Conexivisphaera sp.]
DMALDFFLPFVIPAIFDFNWERLLFEHCDLNQLTWDLTRYQWDIGQRSRSLESSRTVLGGCPNPHG